MTGSDTHMLWAGQQRTLAAAKEQVVAPLPVGPVVGLHMEDLVGPGSMSGRSSDYASTEACLPQVRGSVSCCCLLRGPSGLMAAWEFDTAFSVGS